MRSRFLFWVVAIAVILLILACMGIDLPPVVFLLYLAFGWGGYLGRVLPQVHVVWSAVLTAVACLAGVLFLGHLLARWLYRETTPADLPARHWKPAWTATAAAIFFLTFASGIATVDITHQSVWLAKSDKRMFRYGGRSRETANRVSCASHMRQIGQAVQMYAKENGGRFPDNLEQLLLTQDITPEAFTCPGSDIDRADGKTPREQARQLRDHCSYVYHGAGLTDATPGAATRPVLCEPLIHHKFDGMNVLFADGHAEFLGAVEAQKVLQSIGN